MVIELDPLSTKSVRKAIELVKERRGKLKTDVWIGTRFLAESAQNDAQDGFDSAVNAGPDGAHVYYREVERSEGKSVFRVIATGSQVLFIEFGTGVLMDDNPIERAEIIDASTGNQWGLVPHGGFGQGRGANEKGWVYPVRRQGDAMLPERTEISTRSPTVYHTWGQPAQSPLWRAKNKVRKHLKEAFNDDR